MELQKYEYEGVEYYVDYRLSQFRSITEYPNVIEFIDFDSERGDIILSQLIKDGKADFEKLRI